MCRRNVYIDEYPDKTVEFRQTILCRNGSPEHPCKDVTTHDFPARKRQAGEMSTRDALAQPDKANARPQSASVRRSSSARESSSHSTQAVVRRANAPVTPPLSPSSHSRRSSEKDFPVQRRPAESSTSRPPMSASAYTSQALGESLRSPRPQSKMSPPLSPPRSPAVSNRRHSVQYSIPATSPPRSASRHRQGSFSAARDAHHAREFQPVREVQKVRGVSDVRGVPTLLVPKPSILHRRRHSDTNAMFSSAPMRNDEDERQPRQETRRVRLTAPEVPRREPSPSGKYSRSRSPATPDFKSTNRFDEWDNERWASSIPESAQPIRASRSDDGREPTALAPRTFRESHSDDGKDSVQRRRSVSRGSLLSPIISYATGSRAGTQSQADERSSRPRAATLAGPPISYAPSRYPPSALDNSPEPRRARSQSRERESERNRRSYGPPLVIQGSPARSEFDSSVRGQTGAGSVTSESSGARDHLVASSSPSRETERQRRIAEREEKALRDAQKLAKRVSYQSRMFEKENEEIRRRPSVPASSFGAAVSSLFGRKNGEEEERKGRTRERERREDDNLEKMKGRLRERLNGHVSARGEGDMRGRMEERLEERR